MEAIGDEFMQKDNYSIWIEAECWDRDDWNIYDCNTDVVVEFCNGERWIATFFTYKNIITLANKNSETGECLSGKYLHSKDMILIDESSRESIEKVIKHFIDENEFEYIFSRCE